MTAAFTPGPWRIGADLCRVHPYWRDEHGNSLPECFHRNGYAKTIAAVGKEDGDWRNVSQAVADAYLIAAAPDLYDLLFEIEDSNGSWLRGDLGRRIRSTLAKARGAR